MKQGTLKSGYETFALQERPSRELFIDVRVEHFSFSIISC